MAEAFGKMRVAGPCGNTDRRPDSLTSSVNCRTTAADFLTISASVPPGLSVRRPVMSKKRKNVYREVAASLPVAGRILATHGFDPFTCHGMEDVSMTILAGFDGRYSELSVKAQSTLDRYGERAYVLGIAMGLLLNRTAFDAK